jgi:hypothetical protein
MLTTCDYAKHSGIASIVDNGKPSALPRDENIWRGQKTDGNMSRSSIDRISRNLLSSSQKLVGTGIVPLSVVHQSIPDSSARDAADTSSPLGVSVDDSSDFFDLLDDSSEWMSDQKNISEMQSLSNMEIDQLMQMAVGASIDVDDDDTIERTPKRSNKTPSTSDKASPAPSLKLLHTAKRARSNNFDMARITPAWAGKRQKERALEPTAVVPLNQRSDKYARPNDTYTIVGPDSGQMNTIKRMRAYVDEMEATAVVEIFGVVKRECEIRHERGERRYLHLPGAIFEGLVERLGGVATLRIYTNALTYINHPSFVDLNVVDPEPVNDVSSSDPPPNLLEVAVGYGIHLAAGLSKDAGKIDIESVVHDGANAVMGMKDQERLIFWDYMRQFQSRSSPTK